eukprot:5888338-Heterocapsa_arctica.AAC.1
MSLNATRCCQPRSFEWGKALHAMSEKAGTQGHLHEDESEADASTAALWLSSSSAAQWLLSGHDHQMQGLSNAEEPGGQQGT